MLNASLHRNIRVPIITIALLFLCTTANAAPNNQDAPFIWQQQKQKAQEQEQEKNRPDVRFNISADAQLQQVFPVETPCFSIQHVELDDIDAFPTWLRLKTIARNAQGRCLGSEGINLLVSQLQNRLIDRGYITSRVVVPEQDITSGTLRLRLIPGRINHITKDAQGDSYIRFFNTLPTKEGELLNLRDIEQGLENLQSIPTASADVSIVPSDKLGESDLVILWQQPKLWRVTASVDDSGTRTTGRYLGTLAFNLDNPTSLGDSLYLSGTRDLEGLGEKGNRNEVISYSIPWGYWRFSASYNRYKYHQNVAGGVMDYEYRGRSNNLDLNIERLLYRDQNKKTTLHYTIKRRTTKNFIDDTEVDIQRRETAAWVLGLSHRHYIDRVTLNGGIDYQRGTRWFGAQPAPEENTGDATALAKIVTLFASIEVPFQLGSQPFSYSTSYQQQFAKSKLTSLDRFSIGGRWTVRGFDGELNLSADDGWLIRNDLTWYLPIDNQQLYLGIDHGQVRGNNSEDLLGKNLTGAVLGLRGALPKLHLSYEAFMGKPIAKPTGFQTDNTTFGFSLAWQY